MTLKISLEDVRFFEENGYLHLKNVISNEELAALRAHEEKVSGAAEDLTVPSPHYGYETDPITQQKLLCRIYNTQLRGGAFLEAYGNPALLSVGEALLGPDFVPMGVILVVKRPGFGAGVPWHRDPSGYRLAPGINAGIYLDDATPENGMLYVVPGSHKITNTDFQQAIEENGFHIPGSIPVPAQAGDIVIHSEHVLHGSRVVRTQNKRRVLYYGIRSIAEQLSRGGKYTPAWVRYFIRTVEHAIRERAKSVVGHGEERYEWKLSAEYKVSLKPDEYVEMNIEG
jgi:phytanoyl-CoA hydroxylase